MKCALVTSLLLLGSLAGNPPATAAEHRIEALGAVGYTMPLRDPDGAFPGGPSLSLQAQYLSPSGLGTFLSGGWTRLFTDTTQVMDSWNIEAGLAIAWWRFQVDAGLGASVLSVFASVDGVEITPIEPALTYSLGFTGIIWDGPVDLGAQLKAHIVSGTDIAWLTLNITVGASLFEAHGGD
ncbi:MAG: hypothetical protein ACPGU1_20055 [Myxococcota bacterium]